MSSQCAAPLVGILKYPGSNARSVMNAYARLGVESFVSSDEQDLRTATHIVIPGQGEASSLMKQVNSCGLQNYLFTTTQPALGICLGMQALFEHSYEGNTKLLGLIPGEVYKLTENKPIPHTGWASIHYLQSSELFSSIENTEYFYFLHSYRVPNGSATLAEVRYEDESFPAVITVNNWVGVQFHPEKSGSAGGQFLLNFLQSSLSNSSLKGD